MLRGDEQFAVEGGFSRAPVECFGGGQVHEVGIVIGFRDVGEDQEARAGVKSLGGRKVFADDVIGKMAGAAHHPLLYVPRVRPDFEHFQVMIRFENQAVGIAQMEFHQLGQIAEVGDNGDFGAIGAKRIADGIGGVMWNGKRGNFDVSDGEFLAGANVFHALKFFCGSFGQEAEDFGEGAFREISGGAEVAQELGKSAGMVGVLVGNQNGVNVIGILVECGEAAKGFFPAEPGVHQQASALGFKQRGVARAAGSENGNSKADSPSQAARFRRAMNCATCAA